MRVALTFDDGPSEWTAPILDILAANDARATFFVCGASIITGDVQANINLIDRITDEGHEVGNHTTNHPDLSLLDDDDVRREFAETTAMLHAITGQIPQVWRAPYLRLPREMPSFMAHIGCNVMPGDWNRDDGEAIAREVIAQATDQAVVLLHDGRPPGQPAFADGGSLDTRDATVAAVERIVPALSSVGVELVTASQMWQS